MIHDDNSELFFYLPVVLTLDYLWLYCTAKKFRSDEKAESFFSPGKTGHVPHDAHPYHRIVRAKGIRNRCIRHLNKYFHGNFYLRIIARF